MNRAITRLFVAIILLFTLLIAFTSRWTVFSATALQNNSLNKLAEFASWEVKRGRILADNGQVLARSVPLKGGVWSRHYPQGSLFSQTVGYSIIEDPGDAAGLEKYFLPQLSGPTSALASVFGSFNGGTKVGDDVYSTLDPKLQALARSLLANVPNVGHATGSVVALVPQTGAVKAMYSSPTYNDNRPNSYQRYGDCNPNPFNIPCTYNLATQGRFPPGSTFKIVTTAAALNSGKATPNSLFSGQSPVTISGTPLENDDDQSYGQVTLTQALTDSINTVYAPLGVSLGDKVMLKYMRRFGFYSTPPLQYPADEMQASGELDRKTDSLVTPPGPCRSFFDCVDVGRMSIGQDKLAVTPLQMAMVVSAVADDGRLMEPRLATKVVNQDGQVVETFPPKVYDQVMTKKVAGELQVMMRHVVEEGTGQAANLENLPIAGKTGTASTAGTQDGEPLDDAWFIGFPINDPKIAVAVMLENIREGYGGTYAAPIAADIIKAYLAEHP